jgi:hypothetical protein
MRRIVWAALCCLVLAAGGKLFPGEGRGDSPKEEKWPRIDQG